MDEAKDTHTYNLTLNPDKSEAILLEYTEKSILLLKHKCL